MQPKQQDSEPSMSLLVCSSPLVPVVVVARMLRRDTQSPVGISRRKASFGGRAGPGGLQQLHSPSRGFMRDTQTEGGKAATGAERDGNDSKSGREGRWEEGRKGGETGRPPPEMQLCKGDERAAAR